MSRPKGYGLSLELARKREANYSVEREQEALEWIGALLDEPDLFAGVEGSKATQEKLKDGVILAKVINILQPSSIKKINDSKMAFKMMENIGNFLTACEAYGVSRGDLFQTVDLYDGTNMNSVINSIHALGRKAQSKGFGGPTLGPKEATQNVREFTDEQLKAGNAIIGLQAGSNKGASQAGMNFGKTRAIMD